MASLALKLIEPGDAKGVLVKNFWLTKFITGL